jgi:hypothetical protein
MRRALASLLLALFSFPLIAAVLLAETAPDLPSCCRRSGAHHCVTGVHDNASQDGPAFRLFQRCPAFPLAPAVTVDTATAILRTFSAISAGLVSHPAIQRQTEALGRISFSRSRQKRGPPSPLA